MRSASSCSDSGHASRQVSSSKRGDTPLTRLHEHTRYAFRRLRRAPLFSAVAIALLGLGIATTSAVFSVAIAVLIRDLPIRDQNRVVALWATGSGAASEVPTTLERYGRFRHVTKELASVAGFAHYGSNMSPLRDERGNPQYARESLVTGNFFDVLGTTPVIGRLLRPDDDVVGAALVMVISEPLWRRTFGGDPGVIGRHLEILNRQMTATIVGVAPSGLEYPSGTEYWIPIVPTKYPAVDIVARLAPTATAERARAELATFIENDTRAFPNDLSARSLRATGAAVHRLPELIIGPVRQPLIIVSVAVAALLLIACVNVGNLLLVRATIREHELAIRRALGARSVDILLQLAAEAAVLAIAGALVGAALAFALLRVLVAIAPAGLPRVDQIALSPSAVGVATVAAVVAVFVAGVLPPFFFGTSSTGMLRVDGRAGKETSRRRTLRSAMVATQIALALVLLTVSALLLRSLSRLEGINLGYAPAHLSIVQITAPYRKYANQTQFNDAFDEVQRQFRAVPGVTAVSPVLAWPFMGPSVFATRLEIRSRPELNGPEAPYVSWDAVGADFSRAMSSPIIRGRGISESDREGAPRVAVVTQDLANRYWPGEDPLGKQLRFAAVSGDTAWRTVVGVIAPLNYRSLREATPTVLFAYRQEFQQGIFVVRSTRDLDVVLPALRRAASASDRDIVLWRAQTMDQVIAGPLSRPRFEAFLVAVFGGLALLLAAAGLYGVTAYLVRQHTREYAIRVALGATTGHVLRLALGGALQVALIGALVGVGVSLLMTRLVAGQLFAVSASDPVSVIGAGLLLVFVTVLAAYVPARRAAAVDSARALRSE
jgi:putative ABC transport system permease protein